MKYSTFLERVLAKVLTAPEGVHPLYWNNQVIGEARAKKVCIAHNLRYIEELGVTGEWGMQYHFGWFLQPGQEYGLTAENILKPEALIAAHTKWLRDRIAATKKEKANDK